MFNGRSRRRADGITSSDRAAGDRRGLATAAAAHDSIARRSATRCARRSWTVPSAPGFHCSASSITTGRAPRRCPRTSPPGRCGQRDPAREGRACARRRGWSASGAGRRDHPARAEAGPVDALQVTATRPPVRHARPGGCAAAPADAAPDPGGTTSTSSPTAAHRSTRLQWTTGRTGDDKGTVDGQPADCRGRRRDPLQSSANACLSSGRPWPVARRHEPAARQAPGRRARPRTRSPPRATLAASTTSTLLRQRRRARPPSAGDVEVLPASGHHALVGSDHEQDGVEAVHPRQHIGQKASMAGTSTIPSSPTPGRSMWAKPRSMVIPGASPRQADRGRSRSAPPPASICRGRRAGGAITASLYRKDAWSAMTGGVPGRREPSRVDQHPPGVDPRHHRGHARRRRAAMWRRWPRARRAQGKPKPARVWPGKEPPPTGDSSSTTSPPPSCCRSCRHGPGSRRLWRSILQSGSSWGYHGGISPSVPRAPPGSACRAQSPVSGLLQAAHQVGAPAMMRPGGRRGAVAGEDNEVGTGRSVGAGLRSPATRSGVVPTFVVFSGDKLLGGPRPASLPGAPTWCGGLARARYTGLCRPDKLTLAALERRSANTFRGTAHELPLWRMLRRARPRPGPCRQLAASSWAPATWSSWIPVGGGSLPGRPGRLRPCPGLAGHEAIGGHNRSSPAARMPPVVARIHAGGC